MGNMTDVGLEMYKLRIVLISSTKTGKTLTVLVLPEQLTKKVRSQMITSYTPTMVWEN